MGGDCTSHLYHNYDEIDTDNISATYYDVTPDTAVIKSEQADVLVVTFTHNVPQSNVNMTRKEFYDEKREQGANIGNQAALDMMAAAEKKQQAQKKDTSLADKLTDGVRASE